MPYIAYIGYMSHNHIILLIEMLAAARHRSPHTIGRLASGSGDFYARLAAGHDLTTRRASRVVRYLSDHWPAGVEWPAGVPRPPNGGIILETPRRSAGGTPDQAADRMHELGAVRHHPTPRRCS